MGLIVTIPDEPPRSVLPPGGSPRGDAEYLAWRDATLDRAADLTIARRWHEALETLPTLTPARFDSRLFAAVHDAPLLAERFTYSHRLRYLAVALETRRAEVEAAAWRIITDGFGRSE